MSTTTTEQAFTAWGPEGQIGIPMTEARAKQIVERLHTAGLTEANVDAIPSSFDLTPSDQEKDTDLRWFVQVNGHVILCTTNWELANSLASGIAYSFPDALVEEGSTSVNRVFSRYQNGKYERVNAERVLPLPAGKPLAPYTPGPWKVIGEVGHDPGDYDLSVVTGDEVECEIAAVYTSDVAPAQAEADARLIAAAPDFHRVARALWSALDRVRSRDARWLGPELRHLHDELSTVIRKSEGQPEPTRRAA